MTNQNEYLKSTKLITAHYGEEYEHYYNAIVPPVFMNSLNVFETLEDYYDFDRTDKHKYCYGRVQNPTVRILEDKIAALEHGVGALAFASGMAAATTAVLTACKAGSHVVCLHNAYGPLKDFLSKYCTEHLDITLTYVTGDRVEEFEAAVTDSKVGGIINDKYVLISLYVDDKTPLNEPINVVENDTERTLRTVGDKWSYLQRVKFGANAQPFYVLLDNDGNPLNKSYAYNEDIPKYIEFLQEGLERYVK